MKNLYRTALVILTFSLFSCSSDSDSNDNPNPSGTCTSNIAFFQTGKYQKYKLTQFGSDAGTMKLTYGACNGTGLISTMEFRNTANVVTGTVQNKFWQDGVWMINDANNDGIDPRKLYKTNAALNDTWSETDADGAVVLHTVVDIDSLITVPAGSFHCKVYHYEKSDIINDSYIFWNDEFGQIMEDAGFFKIELMEYN
ncbi:MAG: hypothetical protein IPP30_11745 [Flavobacterium sp.]|nr:hypothetical protein [Flavobacterium sp.]